MKLLHIISGGDVGGAKTHVLSLLAGLNRTETVHLVCFMEGDFVNEARLLGIPVTVFAEASLSRARKRILAMIRHDGYQLIHCHGARANLMGLLLRKRAGIPIVSTVHSDYRLDYMGRPLANLTYGSINRFCLPRFDAWIGVSDGMRDLLISRGFDPQRVHALYNGVDFNTPRHPLPREDYLRSIGLEAGPDTVVFGIAARISPVKDMTTLVRAFAQAQKTCPHIRLAIAGEGEQEAEIRALAAELCPAGTVCFAGWVKDVDSFYAALDVNVLTSLSETFPYALTEGARMRCATIASRVGGVPYLIDDGKNGLLFRPQDVETLAGHMVRLAQNADLRRQMGEALYEKTRRDFSLETMLVRQKEIYTRILRRAARPQGQRDGVLICGAYGKGNGGDNAILSAICNQLHSIDPDLPICALSRDPAETRLCAGIDAVYTFNIFCIAKKMRHTRLYISGGGTLMQDATSTRSLLYYLFSIRQAARHGCRVMLYGCGVGPISRSGNRRRAARVLNRCAEVISVRDQYSRDFLTELGVMKPEIHLTADPALLIDPPDSELLQAYLRDSGLVEGQRYLLLSVRPWHGFEAKVGAFARAADYAYEKYGLVPLLYCMEPNRDQGAARAVAAQLHCPHLLLNVASDGNQVIATVRRMSLVLSMRLHPLIFAAGQGVPMVGVVYDPKVSGFLDDLGQQRYLDLKDVTARGLCAQIDSALAGAEATDENVSQLRRLSRRNEELAAGLLQK